MGDTDNDPVTTTRVNTQRGMPMVVMTPRVLLMEDITKAASMTNTTAINNIMTRDKLVMVAAVGATPRKILRPSATSP
jgi:coenzyme F420-reducing hydrogenase beta subunit